jgi:hypothetical protein
MKQQKRIWKARLIIKKYFKQIFIQVLSTRKRKKYSHKLPGVGQTKFQPEYAEKFGKETIERGKNEGKFLCVACNGNEYDLGKGGTQNIENHPNFVHLKILVSKLLSIFSSNAFCESVFSVVKNVKTDERNQMKMKLLNSLVSIKFNSDFNCQQSYNLFISNPELLKKVKLSDKYKE